jgi:hypothetical protein
MHKRARISEPMPSLSHNAQEFTPSNLEVIVIDEASQPSKRIKSEVSTVPLRSGFAPVDSSKLDLPFLKSKINQVLKSFANKKNEQPMDKRGAPEQSHSGQTHVLNSNFKANEKLDRYISKAYKKCMNAKEQAYMSGLLEQIIQESQKQGDVSTKNWDMTPLPLLPREKQDNLNLVLNSQFLQINKNVNSSLLSAIPKNDTQSRTNPRDPQMNLLNSLMMPPPTHPTQLLNSLKLSNIDIRNQGNQSRLQQPIGKPMPMNYPTVGQMPQDPRNSLVQQLTGQYQPMSRTTGNGRLESGHNEKPLKEKSSRNEKLAYRIDTSSINGELTRSRNPKS